ncbi:hypothetical protein CNEO4_190003 [Clostridium neonatale]|nr:hypothetical protein CNEO4_190003 [Clostridium neonatale]CAI3630359.1 hypothetical protein CNEO4_320084 [Clostridium neonatale]
MHNINELLVKLLVNYLVRLNGFNIILNKLKRIYLSSKERRTIWRRI